MWHLLSIFHDELWQLCVPQRAWFLLLECSHQCWKTSRLTRSALTRETRTPATGLHVWDICLIFFIYHFLFSSFHTRWKPNWYPNGSSSIFQVAVRHLEIPSCCTTFWNIPSYSTTSWNIPSRPKTSRNTPNCCISKTFWNIPSCCTTSWNIPSCRVEYSQIFYKHNNLGYSKMFYLYNNHLDYPKMSYNNLGYSKMSYNTSGYSKRFYSNNNWEYSKISYNNGEYSPMLHDSLEYFKMSYNIRGYTNMFSTAWNIPIYFR